MLHNNTTSKNNHLQIIETENNSNMRPIREISLKIPDNLTPNKLRDKLYKYLEKTPYFTGKKDEIKTNLGKTHITIHEESFKTATDFKVYLYHLKKRTKYEYEVKTKAFHPVPLNQKNNTPVIRELWVKIPTGKTGLQARHNLHVSLKKTDYYVGNGKNIKTNKGNPKTHMIISETSFKKPIYLDIYLDHLKFYTRHTAEIKTFPYRKPYKRTVRQIWVEVTYVSYQSNMRTILFNHLRRNTAFAGQSDDIWGHPRYGATHMIISEDFFANSTQFQQCLAYLKSAKNGFQVEVKTVTVTYPKSRLYPSQNNHNHNDHSTNDLHFPPNSQQLQPPYRTLHDSFNKSNLNQYFPLPSTPHTQPTNPIRTPKRTHINPTTTYTRRPRSHIHHRPNNRPVLNQHSLNRNPYSFNRPPTHQSLIPPYQANNTFPNSTTFNQYSPNHSQYYFNPNIPHQVSNPFHQLNNNSLNNIVVNQFFLKPPHPNNTFANMPANPFFIPPYPQNNSLPTHIPANPFVTPPYLQANPTFPNIGTNQFLITPLPPQNISTNMPPSNEAKQENNIANKQIKSIKKHELKYDDQPPKKRIKIKKDQKKNKLNVKNQQIKQENQINQRIKQENHEESSLSNNPYIMFRHHNTQNNSNQPDNHIEEDIDLHFNKNLF